MNQSSNETDGTPRGEAELSSAETSARSSAPAPTPAEAAGPAASVAMPSDPEPRPEPIDPGRAALEAPPSAGERPSPVAGARAGRKGALSRFFLMQDRIDEAKQVTFLRGQPGFAEFELARSVLDGADAMSEFPERRDAALLLYRDALSLGARAFVARRADGSEPPGDDAAVWHALVRDDAAAPILAGLGEPERGRIARLLEPGWAAHLVPMSKGERGNANEALGRAARQLVVSLEREAGRITKLKVVRATRWITVLVAVLAVVGGAFFALRSLARPTNLARGKPVTLSSYHRREAFPPERLVDGNTTEIGCHTRSEEKPWAQIDLGAEMPIRRVVVYNRQDRFKQRAVPLVIETSSDGKAFTEFATREDAFTVWDATGAPTKARFVRLQVQKKTELHLTEVEVF